MCHIINPIGSTALKPNAAKRVDAKAAYASKMLDAAMDEQGWTWATVPVEFHLYWMYGALDTVLTAHLFEKLAPEITSRYAEVYNLEQQVQWILADMETHGARIDHDYTTKKSYELEMYGQDVENWCKATYGISPGQNQEVAKVLESLGIPMNIRTPTGSFKLDEDVIMSIIGGEYENVDPNSLNEGQMLAYRVLSRRKSEKIKSTYLDTFLEVTDARGYVHPRINQLGARTGRMSMERPALQTLPRGRVVRDCFIPSDGNSLLTADFDGIEMRCLAHYAQDSALIDAINSGDIHLAMAKLAYQDDTITKKDPRRQIAKSVNFAKIYGAGTEKVALTAGISYEEAKDFLAKYDAMFPGIKEFQNAVGKEVARRKRDEGVAYVHTPLGRIQKTDDDRDYALVNSLIQGMAADVFKEALVRLGESPVAEFMVLPVHDEVVFDIPNEFIEESKIIITKAMADDRWAVPFTVGIEGPLDRWGAKYA
jgi:DNA polymerase-1